MAKIWFVKEGMPGQTDPAGEKPLAWCIVNLGLRPKDWRAGLDTRLVIGEETDLAPYSGPRWVVIQLAETEASGIWKSGYYFSPSIKLDQIKRRLSRNDKHTRLRTILELEYDQEKKEEPNR